MTRSTWWLVTAMVLVGAGALGLAAGAVLSADPPGTDSVTSYVTPAPPGGSNGSTLAPGVDTGARIYTDGVGHDGVIPRSGGFGMLGRRGCADCHGYDGRGRRITMMMGDIQAPDIRYSTLTTPHAEGASTEPAWTDDDIARAVREGVEPSGHRLESAMPLWRMDDEDMAGLIGYLKELSER